MPQNSEPRICVIGALPPPVHGMSTVTHEMLQAIGAKAQVTTIDTSPRSLSRGMSYHLHRLLGVVKGIPRLLHARFDGALTLYMPLDEGLGGLWNLAFLFIARATGMHLFLHHHSFRYITSRTRLMAIMVAIAGRHACHIVLCPTMDARLRELYPQIKTTFVAPNPVTTAPAASIANAPPQNAALTIGMLANLTFEKGVDAFIALIETVPGIRGVLAGPAEADVAHFIEAAIARLQSRLVWLGPVASDAKERFFQSIDVFVFPTRYRTEAYPLVLAEALTRGVTIIAPDRGCIGALAQFQSVKIIGQSEDFIAHASAHLRANFLQQQNRATQRQSVCEEGAILNTINRTAREELVTRIVMSAFTSVI